MKTIRDYLDILKETQLSEQFLDTFMIRGKQCTVFKNPSSKEYKEAQNGDDSVRAFLVGEDILIWNTYEALHQEVREHCKLDKNAISLVLYGNFRSEVVCEVTDNMRSSVWMHNPEIVDEICQHPMLRRMFRGQPEISYFDEAIVGNWRDIDLNNDNEDEE